MHVTRAFSGQCHQNLNGSVSIVNRVNSLANHYFHELKYDNHGVLAQD